MEKLPDIASVIRREQDALAAETRIAQCPPIVAVNSIQEVTRVPSSLRWYYKTTAVPLPQAKGAAFIVDCPSLHSTVLWVGTDNDDYRADYLAFLNATYQLGLTAIPQTYSAKLGLNVEDVQKSVMYLRRKASDPWAKKKL